MLREESQHDRFYGSIAAHYAGIFPLNPTQVRCIVGELGTLEGKDILDVGCGTGELTFALAQGGARVTGIDLNDALLNEARTHRNHERILYRKANMLHTARLFGRSKFDGVICLGNTLVHLMNPMQMRDFFSGVLTVLRPGGVFVLQLLNYDYIFKANITTLPVIETEALRFERTYRFIPDTREIRFHTKLTLKASGEVIDNETDLLGISSNDLISMMDIAGLKNIQQYADFEEKPFTGEHLSLVLISRKIA